MKAIPLHNDLGAEIVGASVVDVVTSKDVYQEVRKAFEKYSVLVFREQKLTGDIQVAFSRSFGPLEITKVGSAGAGTFFGPLTNIAPDGSLVPGDHRESLAARANQLWHTDSSFKARPALASALAGLVIPSSGGQTEFASTRAAWERLEPVEQERLQDLVAVHSFTYSRRQISDRLITKAEVEALPPVRWRLSWENPHNRRRSLYLASHAGMIEGMEEGEGLKLIEKLIADATRPEHVYVHCWRPGDLVIWDNRATLHRGRPWPLNSGRHMVRTTISATDDDGLESVTPAPLSALAH